MGPKERIFKHFKKPESWVGRFIGRMMNAGHRKLWYWCLSHVSAKVDAVILDVGCGGGRAARELAHTAPRGKVYGIDYSKDMVHLARRVNRRLIEAGRVEILHGSVSSLPFPDNHFDLVTAFESYYFWPHLDSDLKEIHRVLKPGGLLVMGNEVYKNHNFARRNSRWAKLAGMKQFHTPGEYYNFLAGAGYSRVEITEAPGEKCILAAAGK